MTTEQKICAAYVAVLLAIFLDLWARAAGSIFGRAFLWLVEVAA